MVFDEYDYKELINPRNIVKDMTMKEFRQWCRIGEYGRDHIQHLKDALVEFQKEELYHHCIIIRDTIKEMENKDKRDIDIEAYLPALPVICAMFVVAKISGFIDWDWVWIISPIWVPGILLTIFYIIAYGKN